MSEIILETKVLPEQLSRLIHSEKVKVRETNGEVLLTPIADAREGCPIRGICADGKLSSYTFMERKQAEKERENRE